MGKYNDEIKEKYNITLLGDINNFRDKVVGVDNDGYCFIVNLADLKEGKSPSKFSQYNPYTIQNIQKYCEINNNKQILLTRDYINSKTKMDWYCTIHEHYYQRSWNSFYQNTQCDKCGQVLSSTNRTLKIDDIIKDFKSIHGDTYDYSETKYIDSRNKIKIICPIHGEFYQSMSSHKRGNGCRKCNYSDGIYNLTLAERNKEKWKDIKVFVYLIKCYNNKELFYKIGITKHNIEFRFGSDKHMPYNYDIIKYIECDLYNAILIEHSIHNQFKDFKYEPEIYFGGHTECFSGVKSK